MKRIFFTIFNVLLITTPLSAQPFQSVWFNNPEAAIAYVDSCADFWLDSYDHQYGGFFTEVDRVGNPSAWNTNKNMLTQTRHAYGFARAFQMTGNEAYLEHAQDALDFMIDSAWDAAYGGWYGEIDRFGNPLSPTGWKSAFNQHYAILGFLANYEATNDPALWNWVMQSYDSNETNLWDNRPDYLGYYDKGSYNWTNVTGKSFNATVDAITTHLLNLYLLTGEPTYLTRMKQVAANCVNHLYASMDQQAIGFAEHYDSHWNIDPSETMTIMGHVLKTAWCLGRINLISPEPEYVTVAEDLVADVWNNGGYDFGLGGPYKDFNRITGDMLMWGNPDTTKAWWQMEQAITAGLMLYANTGNTAYLDMADETTHFFARYFVDHVYGEVYADRTRSGGFAWGENKGSSCKAAYHSIETGYYVYLYTQMFVYEEPVRLFYHFYPETYDRDITLYPLAIAPEMFVIAEIARNGLNYDDFNSENHTIHLPAGESGTFLVTFERSQLSVENGLVSTSWPVLFQNYPNPWRLSTPTTIAYRLSAPGPVSLKIYNTAGQLIKSLVASYLSSGKHETAWDGRSDNGELVGSGVYLYELRTNQFTEVKRMTLIH